MRVLVLSAYAARSHRYWQARLRDMVPDWGWSELNLPPRHFSWRMRGNPLVWGLDHRPVLEAPHDLLIATSMVDLATLRGLVPSLSAIPSLLYFHENQFDYPQDRQKHSLLDAQMVSLYSALAADRIAFNSSWNRDSFLTGVDALLTRLPDLVPTGVVDALAGKACVLPVPLAVSDPAVSPQWPGRPGALPERPLRILWSARFEHDKGGDGLLRILERLDLPFELALTGEQFRESPPAFEEIRRRFAAHIVQFGFLDSLSDFRALQAGADLVLSTALHEFQGLAVLEGVYAGGLPVVPDRLAYREMYSEAFRYRSCPDDPEAEAAAAVNLIQGLAVQLAQGTASPVSVEGYSLEALAQDYRRELTALAG